MSDRTVGIVAAIAGVLLALAGFAADAIGLGEGTGMGYKQIGAVVVGVALFLFGLSRVRR